MFQQLNDATLLLTTLIETESAQTDPEQSAPAGIKDSSANGVEPSAGSLLVVVNVALATTIAFEVLR